MAGLYVVTGVLVCLAYNVGCYRLDLVPPRPCTTDRTTLCPPGFFCKEDTRDTQGTLVCFPGVRPIECFDVGFGHLYKGFQTKTVSGKTCQRWDSEKPHKPYNIFVEKFPDKTLEDAENFCRDPHKDGRPWCYTTDNVTRWEYCDLPQCSNRNCYKKGFERLYQGFTSVTKNNVTCQRWDAMSPHKHTYTDPENYPDPSIAEANNYCRNPSRISPENPWCYTMGSKRWDYCDIEQCAYDYCYDGDASNYRGKMSYTVDGVKCQRWDTTSPHDHSFGTPSNFPDASVADAENHCRDPSKHGSTWCYTTDPDKRWDYCEIKKCGEI